MRSYADACGLARALDVVGERWALLVVRELVLGPKRYTDLAAALPGVGTNVLATRLTELEHSGVIVKRAVAPPTPATVYELTPWGRELESVIVVLGRWGAQAPVDESMTAFSPSSLVLSLTTNFSPERARGVDGRFRLVFGAERFVGEVADARFTIRRDSETDPAPLSDVDVEVVGEQRALADVIFAGESLAAAVDRGALATAGDLSVLDRLLDCFPLPVASTP